jgi:hypothetical protein
MMELESTTEEFGGTCVCIHHAHAALDLSQADISSFETVGSFIFSVQYNPTHLHLFTEFHRA